MKSIMKKINFPYILLRFFSRNKKKTSGKKNYIKFEKCVSVRRCSFHINGDNNKISIKTRSSIKKCYFEIIGSNNKISISENCEVVDTHICIVGDNSHIFIGGNTIIIGPCKFYCGEKSNSIRIGERCMLGFGTVIMSSDAHSIFNEENQLINRGKPVVIKEDVWISSNVTILKGTVVEHGCILGAGSTIANKRLTTPNSLYIKDGVLLKKNVRWDKSVPGF